MYPVCKTHDLRMSIKALDDAAFRTLLSRPCAFFSDTTLINRSVLDLVRLLCVVVFLGICSTLPHCPLLVSHADRPPTVVRCPALACICSSERDLPGGGGLALLIRSRSRAPGGTSRIERDDGRGGQVVWVSQPTNKGFGFTAPTRTNKHALAVISITNDQAAFVHSPYKTPQRTSLSFH